MTPKPDKMSRSDWDTIQALISEIALEQSLIRSYVGVLGYIYEDNLGVVRLDNGLEFQFASRACMKQIQEIAEKYPMYRIDPYVNEKNAGVFVFRMQ